MEQALQKRRRLNIYLDDPEIKRQIKMAAAKRDVSISEYCLWALKRQLIKDGERIPQENEIHKIREVVSTAMDHLRKEIGPIDIPVTELIKEGRRR